MALKRDLKMADPVATSDELPKIAVRYSWMLTRRGRLDDETIKAHDTDMNLFAVCFLIPLLDFVVNHGKGIPPSC